MKKIEPLIIIDYSCHPFSLDLANSLAKNKFKITYFFSHNVNLTGEFYKTFKSKNLNFKPIITNSFNKYNFFLRRSNEISFANQIITFLKKNNFKKVILANMPIDPLFKIIRFCNSKKIDTYFWVQDIYYLAIKNFFKKNKFLYFSFGFLICKFYEYLEKYCFINSTVNIVIDKNFKSFFPNRNKKTYIIENWVPLNFKKKKITKKKIYKKLNIKNKFTFIYTGTLSYKHHFNNLIKLAEKNPDSQILIFSKDKFIVKMKKIIKNNLIDNIMFFNPVPYNELHNYLSLADIGLVNLNKDSNNVCVPSKILSYYSNSLPVLASMPLSNLASKNIRNFKTGLVSDPNSINNYLKNANILKKNNKLRKKISLNCKIYANKKFNIYKIKVLFKNIMKNKNLKFIT